MSSYGACRLWAFAQLTNILLPHFKVFGFSERPANSSNSAGEHNVMFILELETGPTNYKVCERKVTTVKEIKRGTWMPVETERRQEV